MALMATTTLYGLEHLTFLTSCQLKIWPMAFTLLFDYGNVHYLNKRERPLHGKRTSILRDEATLKFKLNQCQVPSIAHGRLFSLFFKNNFINLIVVYIFCYNQGCQISIDFDNQKPAFFKKLRSISQR